MRKYFFILSAIFALALPAQNLEFRHLSVKDGLPHNSILALQQDGQGRLWVATLEGIVAFDGRSFTPVSTDGLPNKRADRILRADDGRMWVRCVREENFLSVYDSVAGRFVQYEAAQLEPDFVKRLQAGYKRKFADPYSSRRWSLDQHLLWQTDSLSPAGSFAYTDNQAKAAGLNDNAVYSLLLDDQGLLWVGTASNGLFFADTRPLSYERIVCQPSSLVRTLCKDDKGRLYIALSDQSLACSVDEAQTYRLLSYRMSDKVEGRRIRALLEDSRHQLWMGTRDGLYAMSAERDSFQRVSLSLQPRQRVYSLCEEDGKWLWIGTENGLFRKSLARQEALPELVDSTYSIIYELAVDTDDGSLWLATETGLYRRTASGPEQKIDALCRSLAVDPQGSVWAGTPEGLCRWNKATGSTDSIAAMAGHTVQSLVSFHDYVWCCYESGVCCVNIFTGQVTWLRTEDNEYLEGADFCDESTGRIYFGGTQGLDCFDALQLDKRLRTRPSMVWLKEQSRQCLPDEEHSLHRHLPWGLLLLAVACLVACLAVIVYRKRNVRIVNSNDRMLVDTMVDETDEQSQPESADVDVFVAQATRIMEAHLADADFSAEQFAAEMCMSRTKFFTLMKAKTGKTVMEFVRDARMEYAVTLLRQGTVVAEVAMKCGYGDTSNFRRTFVKKFGKTPSEYKALMASPCDF